MCNLHRNKLPLFTLIICIIALSSCNSGVMDPDDMDEPSEMNMSIVEHICEANNTVFNLDYLSQNTNWVPIKYWNYVNRRNLGFNNLYLGDDLVYNVNRGRFIGWDDNISGNYKINKEEKTITLESISGTFQNEKFDILHYDSIHLRLLSDNLCSDTCLFVRGKYINQYIGEICTQAEENPDLNRYAYCKDCDFGFRGPNCTDKFTITNESLPISTRSILDGHYYCSGDDVYKFTLAGNKVWQVDYNLYHHTFVDDYGFIRVENTPNDDNYRVSALYVDGEEDEYTIALPIEIVGRGDEISSRKIDKKGNVYKIKNSTLYSVSLLTQEINWMVSVDEKYKWSTSYTRFINGSNYVLLHDNSSSYLVVNTTTGNKVVEFETNDIYDSNEELINIKIDDETIYLITQKSLNGLPKKVLHIKAFNFNLDLKWSESLYSLLFDFDYYSFFPSELVIKATESYIVVYRDKAKYEGEIHVMAFQKNGKLLHNSKITLPQVSSGRLSWIHDVTELDEKLIAVARYSNNKVAFIELSKENTYKPYSSCLE